MKTSVPESPDCASSRLKHQIKRLHMDILFSSVTEMPPEAIFSLIQYAKGWNEPPIGSFLTDEPVEKYTGYMQAVRDERLMLIKAVQRTLSHVPKSENEAEALHFGLANTYHSAGFDMADAERFYQTDADMIKLTIKLLNETFKAEEKQPVLPTR